MLPHGPELSSHTGSGDPARRGRFIANTTISRSIPGIQEKIRGIGGNLHVYQADAYPGLASLVVDMHLPSALLLYSPYLAPLPWQGKLMERGDMPHFLLTPAAGAIFENTLTFVREIIDHSERII